MLGGPGSEKHPHSFSISSANPNIFISVTLKMYVCGGGRAGGRAGGRLLKEGKSSDVSNEWKLLDLP